MPRDRAIETGQRVRVFYGWWILAASFVIAAATWSLSVFGASIYLHAIVQTKGMSIAQIASGVTVFYLTSAVLSLPVGHAIVRVGPKPVMILGALALAASVFGLGHIGKVWHVHLCFALMGVGYAGLGTTAISTTLAPWFERQQGRVVSIALMGASVGGVIGAPVLLLGIDRFGFPAATAAAALIALTIIVLLALFILRHRPQDMGLHPDGDLLGCGASPQPRPRWRIAEAIRTPAFCSVVATFGIALSMQLGFLTHHVALIAPSLGDSGAAATVSVTGISALVGRMLFSRHADQLELRRVSSGLLVLGAAAFSVLAITAMPAALVGASIVFGTTLGNITALSPIIVRREFGADSFGAVFATASAAIGLVSAFGPALWGFLHDLSGGYAVPLLVSAALDIIAAVIVIRPVARDHQDGGN